MTTIQKIIHSKWLKIGIQIAIPCILSIAYFELAYHVGGWGGLGLILYMPYVFGFLGLVYAIVFAKTIRQSLFLSLYLYIGFCMGSIIENYDLTLSEVLAIFLLGLSPGLICLLVSFIKIGLIHFVRRYLMKKQ